MFMFKRYEVARNVHVQEVRGCSECSCSRGTRLLEIFMLKTYGLERNVKERTKPLGKPVHNISWEVSGSVFGDWSELLRMFRRPTRVLGMFRRPTRVPEMFRRRTRVLGMFRKPTRVLGMFRRRTGLVRMFESRTGMLEMFWLCTKFLGLFRRLRGCWKCSY